MMARGQITNPQFPNQQLPAPPGYHQPNMGGGRGAPPRWPMMPPQQRPPYIQQPNQQNNAQGSALIAQLTQPPSSMAPTPNQFGQSNNNKFFIADVQLFCYFSAERESTNELATTSY